MGVGVGATETLLTHPDSKGLPDSVSLPLPPNNNLILPRLVGGGEGQLTLGHLVHIHTRKILYPGKMCPQRAIWLPSA